MHKLKIHYGGKTDETGVSHGTVLLEALRRRGYNIYSPCGGNGTCGKCKIYIRNEGYLTSCLHAVKKDLEIVLPEAGEARILSAQYIHSRQLNPEPGPSAALSRHSVGVAVDIGTTTLVLHFIRLASGSVIETQTLLNPQSEYGADVISRINYCMVNPDGLKTLRRVLIDALNIQMDKFARKSGISTNSVVKISICGNTAMLHILLGIDPGPLATVPFTPGYSGGRHLKAAELDLCCNPAGEVKILPFLAAYIGSDIVAGIASLAPLPGMNNTLFIDLGTNGEIALITPDTIYCCATAAGPAFEGANIEHGMGALEGAIKSFEGPGNFRTIGDSMPRGICGSGLLDIMAYLVKSSHITSDGFMESNYTIVPSNGAEADSEIFLTPKDVREIQLAKSAIASGISILIQQAGISLEDIDMLYLAGGFGNYIRVESAMELGMIPYELKDKIVPVGNTSGTGAMLAVRSEQFGRYIDEILSRMHYIEISDDESFVLQFAMNMEFPKSFPAFQHP
jgi:uncharacterized 2Fe-2S/4Fe-4S cluster protein (DUF4445 family)